MDQLTGIVGAEHSLDRVCQAIHFSAGERRPDRVGAMLVTCADESENECAAAFQRGFVNFMVPRLKFAQHAAFRLSNLGGRYDWGAVRIAEEHYAADASPEASQLLVVKVNAHVGVAGEVVEPTYGRLKRYESESECCGALNGLLRGSSDPFAEALREAFISEGIDRLGALRDEARVDPRHRLLLAAIASARLQARQAILDVQDHRRNTTTEFLVVPCVTLNRAERDTELVVGYYLAKKDSIGEPEYYGLGDDPAAYEVDVQNGRLAVSDESLGTRRQARDHRLLVLEEWHARIDRRRVEIGEEQLAAIHREAESRGGEPHQRTRAVLGLLLALVADLDPITAAVLLFSRGATGIHHAFRMHRLVRGLEGSEEAKRILEEVRGRVDHLPAEQAKAMLEVLSREYGR